MKTTSVFPGTLVILALGLLSPLALASSKKTTSPSGMAAGETKTVTTAARFYLPTPPAAKKPVDQGRATLRTKEVRQMVNAQGMTAYQIDPESLAKGIVAVSSAYRKLPAR